MKQGRVVILGGTPRSGKTTPAIRLAVNGFNLIPFDHIAQAMKDGPPEIAVEQFTPDICSDQYFLFLQSLIGSLVKDAKTHGLNYLIDKIISNQTTGTDG